MPAASKCRARGEGRPDASEPRSNLYDDVTAKIIAQMEAGRLPWVQPWGGVPGSARPSLPRNGRTGRAYSGINVLILWGAVIDGGYATQSWLSFKQALDAGGCVRRGERGTTVVYADRFTPDAERTRPAQAGDDARAIPFLKRFTVFNVDQCDGLGTALVADPVPLPDREIVPVAERLIADSGADVRIGGAKAYYAPSPDYIQLPPQPAFHDQINYYRTALHELTHWTGHGSRLARDFSGAFGTAKYAREELSYQVCEMRFTADSLSETRTDERHKRSEPIRSDPKTLTRQIRDKYGTVTTKFPLSL